MPSSVGGTKLRFERTKLKPFYGFARFTRRAIRPPKGVKGRIGYSQNQSQLTCRPPLPNFNPRPVASSPAEGPNLNPRPVASSPAEGRAEHLPKFDFCELGKISPSRKFDTPKILPSRFFHLDNVFHTQKVHLGNSPS